MTPLELRLKVDARVAPPGAIRELARIARAFPGVSPVYVELITSLGSKVLALGDEYKVDPSLDLLNAVRSLLGRDSVRPPMHPRVRWQRVAYIDETYNAKTFWICAVVVDLAVVSAIQESLSRTSINAARAWGIGEAPELHGYELFHRSGGFRGVPVRGCVGIYREALQALALGCPDIVLRGVGTKRIRHQHPHRLAWRWAIESVDELAGEGPILAVADRRVEMERPLERDIRDYIRFGTGGWKSRKIEKVLPDLRFEDSRNDALLQAADLVAFLHQRRLNFPIERDNRSQKAREALWQIVAPHVRVQHAWEPPLTHGEPPEEAPGWAA